MKRLISILALFLSLTINCSAGQMSSRMNGLVALLDFNEGTGTTIKNKVIGGSAVTMINGTWRDGVFGTGFGANGVGQYAWIPYSCSTESGHTVSFWLYLDSYTEGSVIMRSRTEGSTQDFGWYVPLDMTTHILSFYWLVYWSGGGGWFSGGTKEVPLKRWVYAVSTYNPVNLEVKQYYNGVLDTTIPIGHTPLTQTTTDKAVFGCDYWGYFYLSQRLDGVLDDVAIFNRCLSDAEIHAIYLDAVARHQND